MSFVAELARRNVIRMAGLYLVGAWLITQVAGTVLPMFDAPAWVPRSVVVLLALGFVPALVFSWVFELTPAGLKRDAEIDPDASIAPQTARRMDRMIMLVMGLALGYFALDKFVLRPNREAISIEPVAAAGTAQTAASTQPTASHASIAVLPFANMSGKPDEDYFSDGMTEELLNVLAKVPQLRVVARTSVFQFKGKGGDVRDIGNQLGVAHIVEGSVRRDGQQVRVTAQLVRVADGFHVWSETYDRELKSVFALQDDIARQIGEALSRSLDVGPATPTRAPVDPLAYDEYLKGRSLLRRRTDLPQAIAHLEAAVEKAPDFAAGWSSLSLAHEVIYWYEPSDREGAIAEVARAAAAAGRAASLDPDSAASAHMMANVARAQFRYAEAERHYLRAMQLDPSYSDVLEDYSELLYVVGRVAESLKACRDLVALDPYFPVGWMRLLSAAIALDSRADVELAQRRLRAIAPGNYFAKFGALDHALAHGRGDEAWAALAELQPLYPKEAGPVRLMLGWALGEARPDPGDVSAAIAALPAGEAGQYFVARQDVAGYNAYLDSIGPIGQAYYFGDLYSSKPAGHAMLRDPRVKAKLVEFGFVAYWRERGWPEGCGALGEADFECGVTGTGSVDMQTRSR